MLRLVLVAAVVASGCAADQPEETSPPAVQAYEVVDGSHPHDVAPAIDGGVWFTGQRAGFLGHFNPSTQVVTQVPLGQGSAPHGVIVGADGAAWVTDGGLNAIVRVDSTTREIRSYPLPAGRERANLNTATPGRRVRTARSTDREHEGVRRSTWPWARPYGIATTPGGEVYYASLAGNYVGRVDTATGEATVLEPPTPRQGARRVWSDSTGRIWVSEWNAGQLAVFDPASGEWREWRLPGPSPQAYAVYVDEQDQVWVSDFGANTLVRFDPAAETFTAYQLPGPASNVRQILGRPGEVWGAASALDQLVVVPSG
jgi:virginiamycin B lyase